MKKQQASLNVSLNPFLEQWINQQIQSGWYNNASEVVREGLRLLREQQQEREVKLRDLRAAIDEGDASPAAEWEGTEALKRKAREYHAARIQQPVDAQV